MDADLSHTAQSVDIVRRFLESWRRQDIEEIMGFFTADAVYHNVPVAPLQGTAAIRGIFEAFISAFDVSDLEILNIAGSGDLVFAERIDHFILGPRRVDLPVNGVFELKDGRIHAFRDYFDLASFENASGLKL